MENQLLNQDVMAFAEGLGPVGLIAAISPSMRFVLKDLEHRYVRVNQVWLDTFGFVSEEQILGKTAIDLFPAWRAKRYIEEEENVMKEGQIYDYEEYLLNHESEAERWRTLKAPWIEGGEVRGYVNMGVRLGQGPRNEKRGDYMPEIVKSLAVKACSGESMEEIAAGLGMSARTLERRFGKMMRETPAHFRMRCRVSVTKRLLREGVALSEIAIRCNFTDQSHLSRTFLRFEGISPKRYLKRVGG